MTDIEPIRVLVVDDSAFARKVLREVLRAQPGIEVVGHARDGADALERIAELRPDVVTLDLVMPGLDGIEVLHALPPDGPRVVVVSSSDADTQLGIAALEAGAVAAVHKPTALATDRLYEIGAELARAVFAAAKARPGAARDALAQRPSDPSPAPTPAPAPRKPRDSGSERAIVIGTSTGGVQALTRILAALPADLPVPVAAALHIPVGFTAALAERLNTLSALEVCEAAPDIVLRAGRVVLARAGQHLKFWRSGREVRARLDRSPTDKPHHPSVDVLFESAAAAWGAGVVAAVLTGMGDDGLVGARAVRAAGGAVITEAESSCIVYGMPRVVREAGLATAEAPLEAMAEALLRRIE